MTCQHDRSDQSRAVLIKMKQFVCLDIAKIFSKQSWQFYDVHHMSNNYTAMFIQSTHIKSSRTYICALFWCNTYVTTFQALYLWYDVGNKWVEASQVIGETVME